MDWVDEARSYVGFSSEDEARLRDFHARMHPRFAAVIDHFYDTITRHPRALAVITEGANQIARLKCTLREWLTSGLTGDHDHAWFASRARIGRRHVEVGLADHYMFTAMNLIRADLRHLAVEAYGVDATPVCDSLDRWLDLELAIMVHTYQEDSERRLIDRERDVQADRLAAVQRLSAGLAHEVRNPLNAAQLQLQLLARRLRRSGAEDSLLEVTGLVDGEIRRLSQLLQEFLDFARPAQVAAVAADVCAIARQVIDLNTAAAALRGISVILGGDPEVVIGCDPGKVHQILHNVIVNAIEAAQSSVDVEIRATQTGAWIRIHDDGAGIPDAALARLYEPFFSTKEGGTGMGLSITYSLVALHAGEIQARNIEGAEFVITLPHQPLEQ